MDIYVRLYEERFRGEGDIPTAQTFIKFSFLLIILLLVA